MGEFRPKYISFDCYGTLINFEIGSMTAQLLTDQIDTAKMSAFLTDFSAYRFDEAQGEWQPYADLIKRALRRTCKRWGLTNQDAVADQIYTAIPSWGPHPDVLTGLTKLATEYPLVILSNASNNQIHHNVARLGAPFYAVYTAEQAQAYKPRLQAFDYMIDRLSCDPAEILHVSSSLRYDLMSASDVGIRHTVYVERGHGPSTTYYGYPTVKTISEIAMLVGLS